MPTYNILNPDPLNIRPNILPQTQADIEEARVRRAIDLANLSKLQQEPGQENARIGILRDQTNNTAAYQRGDLQLNAIKADNEAAYQQGDLNLKSRQLSDEDRRATEQRHNQLLDTFLGHGIEHGLIDRRGADALFGALGITAPAEASAQTSSADKESLVATRLAGYGAQKTDKKKQAYIEGLLKDPSLTGDPETLGLLKKHLTKMGLYDEGTKGTPATASAAPAAIDETPGYNPQLGEYLKRTALNFPTDTANLGAGLYNNAILPITNLINGLVGASPVRRQPYIPRKY